MRKLLSLMLTIVLCLSLLPNVFAVYIHEESKENIDTDGILACLESVIYDADTWGIDGKLDSLSVGEPIHTYEYLNTGALSEADFVYYPIFSDGVPLLLILKNNDAFTQVSQAFIGALSDYINDSVVIIYDQDEAYILSTSGKVSVAYEFEVFSDERGDITDTSAILQSDAIKWAKLTVCQSLPSLEYAVQPYYDPNYPDVLLNVPVVLQGEYRTLCGVACVCSVGKYFTGISYTPAELTTKKTGRGGSNLYHELVLLNEAIAWLYEEYGVQYPQEVIQYPPTRYDLYDNISAGFPVFGRWDGGSWNHCTVIRGVSVFYDYISMMDPEVGNVTVSTKGTWTDYTTQKTYSTYIYTSPANGQTGYLNGYVSKY